METINNVDILIKNGHVLDPSQNINRITNISIKDGKIYEVGGCTSTESKQIFDAKGMFVTPGFIDFHAHIYKSASDFCAAPEDIRIHSNDKNQEPSQCMSHRAWNFKIS